MNVRLRASYATLFSVMAWASMHSLRLSAEVRLPALISDHMVLQEGGPARVWGWTDPGEAVTVQFQHQTARATADSHGSWQVWLNELHSGPPEPLVVQGRNRVTVNDVLVGEVWLGSGQSNMERAVHFSAGMQEIEASAGNPNLRLFQVAHKVAEAPLDDVQGHWEVADAHSIQNFSALAYFFGQKLLAQRHGAVGLIESAYGGTQIEAWESEQALASADLEFVAQEWSATLATMPQKLQKWQADVDRWRLTASEQERAKFDAGKSVVGAPAKPRGAGSQAKPMGLYNGMIAPLMNYSIRGILWNQGENNAVNPAESYRYRKLFIALINDWRRAWGEGAIPFLFVQLSRYHSSGGFPYLRESQAAALSLVNTGMVVSIDVGMKGDVHYPDKQTLADRMLRVADRVAYGENVESSGPVLKQVTAEPGALRLWFGDVESGLELHPAMIPEFGSLTPQTPSAETADGKLVRAVPPTAEEIARAFVVAGADGKFHPAQTKVMGHTLLISSTDVSDPIQVCYAWEDTSPAVMVWNGAGLPASPFRASLDRRAEPDCPVRLEPRH